MGGGGGDHVCPCVGCSSKQNFLYQRSEERNNQLEDAR